MIIGVQNNPGSARYLAWTNKHSICPEACAAHCSAKETLLQQSKRNLSSETRAVNRLPRKKENPPLGKEEHWIIIFWVLTLGCKIHLPFFRLPFPSTHASCCHFCLWLPPPPPPPSVSRSCRWLWFETRKRRESKRRKPSHRKESRHCAFMGCHDEGAACRRCVWMCF